MRKILKLGETIFTVTNAKNVEITLDGAEEYDATAMSDSEFKKIKADSSLALKKIKGLKRIDEK